MLFSKFILPVFGLLSAASFAVATPVVSPDAIVARDASTTDVTNVLSLIQGLDSTLTSMLNNQQKSESLYWSLARISSDFTYSLANANTMVSQLETTVTGVTSNIKKASLNKADVHVAISVSINIFVVRLSATLFVE